MSFLKWFTRKEGARQYRNTTLFFLVSGHVAKVTEVTYAEHSSTAAYWALGLTIMTMALSYFKVYRPNYSK